MHNGPRWPQENSFRKIVAVLLLTGLLLLVACVKTVKNTAIVLKTYDRIPVTALIERLNNLQAISSLRAKTSIRFVDLKLSQSGKIEPYRPASGLIILQRPELIRMLIRVPITDQNIADMVSNGEQFRIAIYYPDKYKRFLIGSNSRSYDEKLEEWKDSDSDKEKVSSFAKIRPQHITEALLVKPIDLAGRQYQYFVADLQQEESDERANLPPRQVVRSYQVLYLLQQVGAGQLRLDRQLWFDRTQPSVPLARMEIFDSEGALTSQAEYKQYRNLESNIPWPQLVKVTRMHDNYAVEISFQNITENDPMISEQTFMLENNQKLPERDLDTPQQPTSPTR